MRCCGGPVLVVSRIRLGEIEVDFEAHTARRGSTEIHLTHREFEMLRYLAEHQDRVVHRNELLRYVWGLVDGSTTRSVDFAILRLRKKIRAESTGTTFPAHRPWRWLLAHRRPRPLMATRHPRRTKMSIRVASVIVAVTPSCRNHHQRLALQGERQNPLESSEHCVAGSRSGRRSCGREASRT